MGSARLSLEDAALEALLALVRDLKEACAEVKSLLRALSETGKRYHSLCDAGIGENGIR